LIKTAHFVRDAWMGDSERPDAAWRSAKQWKMADGNAIPMSRIY